MLAGANGVMLQGLGLVDSGADVSMYPFDMAQQLGIDLNTCPQEQGNDAGGGSMRCHYVPGIEATFEDGRTIQLAGWFGAAPIILLGRQDFFAAFRQIAFNENKRFFTISD